MSAAIEEYRSRLRDALVTINQLKSRVESLLRGQSEPIAIIGMACRFPGGGDTPERFFQNLANGIDAVTEVPSNRWSLDPISDDPLARSMRWGAFLEQVDQFDAEFFGISPREAARLDPQQRILLETTWEAFERAGIVPPQLAGSRTGVFLGMMTNDYALVDAAAGREQQDAYSTTGNGHCFPAGRLSFTLGLQGPSMVIDTACSSSLVSAHLACQSLRNRDCDLAVVGGVNLMLSAETTTQFSKTRAFSPDGRCKSFDAAANGYVRGEGCGVLIFQRLSDAQKDGNPILAVVRGSAVNQDGRSTGLTTPNVLAQEMLIRNALANAGLKADDIGYIEAHGTGTPLGDPIEINALLAVLGAPRADDSRCRIGAVKTNIGHLEAAAGVAGLIKTVMTFQRAVIPRLANFRTQNPRIDLKGSALDLATKNIPWPRDKEPRRAGISSFGMSGTNAHIILEESPPSETKTLEKDSMYALPLSSRSPEALSNLARSYGAWLTTANDLALTDIIYTAGVRRMHHDHRLLVIARNREELIQKLEAFSRGEAPNGIIRGRNQSTTKTKIVFIFPGQGSQWLGMGRQLLAEEKVFREKLEACAAVIRKESGISILDEIAADADGSRLVEIDIVQPLLFAIEVALATLVMSWGIQPSYLVGHSMGEVAAAHIAGVLSLEDAAKVICRRSALLKRIRGQGAMGLVELPMAEVEQAIVAFESRLSVAASNGPRSTVLAGDPDALDTVLAELTKKGIFCRRVKVDVASHSPQVDVLRGDLVNALREVTPHSAKFAMRSTVTTKNIQGPELDAAYWSDNLRLPVRFSQVIQDLLAAEHHLFVEMSPHPILVPSIEENARTNTPSATAIATLRRETDAQQTLLEALGTLYAHGYEVDWSKGGTIRGRVVPLPTYPWQRKRHWIEMPKRPQKTQRREGVHPLLGADLAPASHPHLHVWEQLFTLDDFPFLNDYRIFGEPEFPGTGYVEMASVAAKLIYGEGCFVIEDLSFERMPAFAEDTRRIVQVSLEEKDRDHGILTISSKVEGDTSWTRYASGTIRGVTRMTPLQGSPRFDEDLRNAMVIDGQSHYARLENSGMAFGPTFRTLTDLRQTATQCLARGRLSNNIGDATNYFLHPALLDASIRAACSLIAPPGNEAAYLPVQVANVRVYQRPEGNLSIQARIDERETGGKTISMVVHDEHERLLFEIGAVTFQALNKPRATEIDPLAHCIFDVVWRKAEGQVQVALDSMTPKQWLIFVDSQGFGIGLVELLRTRRDRVVVVSPASSFERLGADEYRLNPADERQWERALTDAFGKRGFSGAVHCGALDGCRWEETSSTTLGNDLRQGTFGVLTLARAIAKQGWRDTPRLCILTRNAQWVVNEDKKPAISQSPVWGLGRVLAVEYPDLECLRLDLPSEAITSEATFVIQELLSSGAEDQIALRADGRYVARIANVSWSDIQGRFGHEGADVTRLGESPVPADSTILLVGGNDAMTTMLVQWLASQGMRNLAFVYATAPSARLNSMLHAWDASGTKTRSWPAQFTQAGAIDEMLAEIQREMPPLRGIMVVADEMADRPLPDFDAKEFQENIELAIAKIWNLHEATQKLPLDFFVVHSSIAGILGIPGKASHAAIDAFLEALSHARMANHVWGTNIRWGNISDSEQQGGQGGAHQAIYQNASFDANEAAPILGRILTQPIKGAALMHFDVHQWVDVFPQMAEKPFLMELVQTSAQRPTTGETSFREHLERFAPERRLGVVETHLLEHLGKILRLEPTRIDKNAPFASLGMDSLMSLELRNRLETSLGLKLSAALLFTYSTTATLAKHLIEKVFSAQDVNDVHMVASESISVDVTHAQDQFDPPVVPDDEKALIDKLSSFEEYLE